MNEQIPENEQWKLNGDCKKCRKASYCRKECGASQRATKRFVKALGDSVIDSILPEPYASHVKEWY